MKARPRAWWIERLLKAGVPGGAVRDVQEALNSPEAAGRRMVRDVPHPLAGLDQARRLADQHVRHARARARRPRPRSASTRTTVLRDVLGMDAAAIAALRKAGAIG
jgi:crotonobetainyl-CoA:carnitine CoA-transferase CaiB-like acyl-CoA transferase